MKIIAGAVMALAWMLLGGLLANIAVVVPVPDAGLANPTLRIELKPGTQAYCLAAVLAALVFSWLYMVVAWIDWRLEALRAMPHPVAERDIPWQPRSAKRLKAAIRAGDVEAVRRWAVASALVFEDGQLLTPYELAELYGDPAVIGAVETAFLRCFGRPPPSRFGAYTDSRKPYFRTR